jgi:hypothetical protein
MLQAGLEETRTGHVMMQVSELLDIVSIWQSKEIRPPEMVIWLEVIELKPEN